MTTLVECAIVFIKAVVGGLFMAVVIMLVGFTLGMIRKWWTA